MEIKHSVIIITYNQEKLIARAVESVLNQKEYLHEIIIADDCSTDKNWQIIQGYQRIHPDLIKPYQNKQNLGIFGNIESTWNKASGNMIWYLSGDDEYCPGVFIKATELILQHDYNPEAEYFTIYFDFKRVNPQGKSKAHSNSKVIKHNPLSLKLRNLIYNRTVGISKNVYRNFFPVNNEIGIAADGLQDIQIQFFSKKTIYYKMVGSIYYTNIGIGSKTASFDGANSLLLSIPEYRKILPNLPKSDQAWLNFLESRYSCEICLNGLNISNLIGTYCKSFTLKYGIAHIARTTVIVIILILRYIAAVV